MNFKTNDLTKFYNRWDILYPLPDLSLNKSPQIKLIQQIFICIEILIKIRLLGI